MDREVKCYSVDLLVEFDTLRAMPPGGGRPCEAAGYLQYFYCTERSKEKAKKLVVDFVRGKEMDPESCTFKCCRIAWMRGLGKREQLTHSSTVDLADESFERRTEIGIWYYGEKEYLVSEADYLASL